MVRMRFWYVLPVVNFRLVILPSIRFHSLLIENSCLSFLFTMCSWKMEFGHELMKIGTTAVRSITECLLITNNKHTITLHFLILTKALLRCSKWSKSLLHPKIVYWNIFTQNNHFVSNWSQFTYRRICSRYDLSDITAFISTQYTFVLVEGIERHIKCAGECHSGRKSHRDQSRLVNLNMN